jgi:transposase
MKPYSLDLRRRIVDTYIAGGISQRQLADRFCVNLSFVSRLLKRYHNTNSLAPKVRTQQTPSKLNEEQLQLLRQLVLSHSDATLAELCQLLKEKTGVLIGVSTMDRMVRLKLGITTKKKSVPLQKRY